MMGSAAWLRRFHQETMKTFVLFFFSVRLIVIARRVKERMYAPGGIGFIAAKESFDRAAKTNLYQSPQKGLVAR